MQNRNFTEGGRWDTVVKVVNFGAFESHVLTRALVEAPKDSSVRALANRVLVQFVVSLEIRGRGCHIALLLIHMPCNFTKN